METKNSFRDHLNKSSEIVSHWPSWKQNVEHDRVESLNNEDTSATLTSSTRVSPSARKVIVHQD